MLPVEPGAAVVDTRGVRVLFASTAGAGHFHPLKPFVEACLRQGDDVLVAGPPALADSVAGAGYAYWRFDEPPPDELGEVWSRVATVSADEANVIVIRDVFGRLDATAGLPRLRQGCEEWRPDIVVRETAEYGSAIAAELSGIPMCASASVWRRWRSSRCASWPRRSTSYAARSAWRPIRAPRRCAAPPTSRWSRRRWRIPQRS